MATYKIFDDGIHTINITNIQSSTSYDSNQPSALPVCINSCGCNYYKLNSERTAIHRPEGRSDYQLIYIHEGKGNFLIGGSNMALEAGSLILFKPGDPQRYSYDTAVRTQAYWIHFSGTEVETLLRQNNLWGNAVYTLNGKTAFPEIITKITRELQFHTYQYSLMCHAYFLELLCSLTRALDSQQSFMAAEQEALVPALDLIHNNSQNDYDISYLAGLCDMSNSHFIRKFKSFTGYPPHRYMSMVRIAYAKEMLLSDDSSVSEIANKLGYDNPLYFSRLFKKYTGTSPSEFKKQMY